VEPSNNPQGPAPSTNGPASGTNGAAKAKRRNVQYPIQLRVNITPAMNASLGRISRQLMMPEGIVGRIALLQYLAHQDPEYREG
jgi:hypothetical protein